MEAAQRTILQCVSALSGGGDPRLVSQSEAKLKQLSQNNGYGMVLVSIFANSKADFKYRQLTGILLKNHIVNRWSQHSKTFTPPVISDQEKKELRKVLPRFLGDPHPLLRSAAAMAMASMGQWDYPERWPELLPSLVKCLEDKNPNLVQGSLRCLGFLAEHITDEQVAKSIHRLAPALLKILKIPQFSLEVRAKSIKLYQICLKSVYTVRDSDNHEKLLNQTIRPTLKPWLESLHGVLQVKLRSSAQNIGKEFVLHGQAAKTAVSFQELFPELIGPFAGIFTKTLAQSLASTAPVYQNLIVQGGENELYDEEGDAVGFSVYLSYALHFFTLLLRTHLKSGRVDGNLLSASVDIALGYMQITQAEAAEWEQDPNEFVMYEDNLEHTYTVRASAADLLNQVSAAGDPGIALILKKVGEFIRRVEERRRQGQSWWQAYEASIFSLGLVSGQLESKEASVQCLKFIESAVVPVLLNPHAKLPFVHARAVWCVSQYADKMQMLGQGLLPSVFQGIHKALDRNYNMAVRWCASRALTFVCVSMEGPEVETLVAKCLPAACQLLAEEAKEETIALSLETIHLCCGVSDKVTASVAPQLTELLLRVWAKHNTNPHVTEAVNDIIANLATNPSCAAGVMSKCTPAMVGIIKQGCVNKKMVLQGTVERAIQLLAALIRSWDQSKPLPSALFSAVSPLFRLMLETDDNSAMQAGSGLLTLLLRRGKSQMLQGKIQGRSVMEVLSMVVNRLLSPNVTDYAACEAGPLLTQLVFGMGKEIGQNAASSLVSATAKRLVRAEKPVLIASLVTFLAHVVKALGPNRMLSALENVDSKNNIMPLVMTKWVMTHGDFYSCYAQKCSLIALGMILTSGDPRPYKMHVQVERVREPPPGRRPTRQNAGTQKLKIMLATEMVALLCREYHQLFVEKVEAEARKANGGDSDDDEEVDLSEMLFLSKPRIEDEVEEIPEIKDSPFYPIDLMDFISNVLRSIKAKGGPALAQIGRELDQQSREIFEVALKQNNRQPKP